MRAYSSRRFQLISLTQMGPSNTVPLPLARMIMEKPEATLMKTIFIQNWRIVPENTAEPF